ncbi:hypothetical protein OHA71_04820 [Streptomyces sp. NBC_00444]|uniref:hypothetical protein n=1 Tax=Streptomyces sp. NBC_00444 TaxID=2975744 RepID=UPI002E1C49EE
MRLFRKKSSGRYEIGILFNIGALGSLYGQEAYHILFSSLDPQRMTGSSFHDGDTEATLYGGANLYCIAVRAPAPQPIRYVRDILSSRTDAWLPTPDRRFLEGDVTGREPLVHAGDVDGAGRLVASANGPIRVRLAEGTAWTVVPR